MIDNKYRVLDLFSGIGGFSLGLEATGHFETIAFVEKDKFCQKVLQKNFKNIPIMEDIRNVKGHIYQADVITGGFPCQPFSTAGKRKGTDDDRYLWDETIRVIRECKPKWFIGENVEGIINIQDGMVLRQVQDDLEREGFEVRCLIIPASGIGGWHQRKRVWIIAYSDLCRERTPTNDTSKERQHNSKTKQGRDFSLQSEPSRYDEDVPDSSNSGNKRTNRKMDSESKGKKRTGNKSSVQTFSSCSDVPNSNSRLRGRRRTIEQSGENKIWKFYSKEEEQARVNIRGKTIGHNVVPREEDVSNTSTIRRPNITTDNTQDGQKEFSKEDVKLSIKSSLSSNVPNTNTERLQRHNSKQDPSKQKLGLIANNDDEERETWWQTESRVCGVPNGVSYELDKDRARRVKALGNSIVPQIVYEIGKAIASTK